MAAPAGATKRLKGEYNQFAKEGFPQFVRAAPDPANILTCYYVLEGPPDTPYEGGYYLGKLVFPPEYPMKPPSIYMLTPSGRFQTGVRLCMSMSDFHAEQWNPMWKISTILVGVLSFMTGAESTTGSVVSTDARKRQLAAMSPAFNLQQPIFDELFPDLAASLREKQREHVQGAQGQSAVPDVQSVARSWHSDALLFVCLVAIAYVASTLVSSHA